MNKEIKYIPGDLVMTNGIPIGTKNGIVYQVTESNPDKYRPVEDGNAFTEQKGSVTLSNIKGKTVHDEGFLFGDCGAWVKDIVPIPLVPAILEKNGWVKEKERNVRTEINYIHNDGVMFSCGSVLFERLFDIYTFADGVPFGVKMKE